MIFFKRYQQGARFLNFSHRSTEACRRAEGETGFTAAFVLRESKIEAKEDAL